MSDKALPTLGSMAKDRATGIYGTVVCHEVWLYGTARIGILRDGVDHNGTAWPLHWAEDYWVEAV